MKVIKASAILISLYFLIGCSSPDGKYSAPKFRHVNKDVSFEYVTEDLQFSSISNFGVYDNQITIVAYDQVNENFVHIYDASSGKHLRSGVRYGDGPGEIVHAGKSLIDSDGVIHIHDFMRKSYLVFDTTDDIDILDENYLSSTTWTTHMFPLSDGNFVNITVTSPNAIFEAGKPRIFIDDRCLDTLARYNEHSLEANENRHFLYSSWSVADISPNGKHLAIGLGLGCILETFELGTEIRRTGLKYFIKPEVSISKNDNSTNINYDNTIWGFSDIELSNNYIYAAYDGKKGNKIHNNIAVFDLTGEPVSITDLGNNDIQRLYVDEPSGDLFAVIENESGEIRIIRIKIDDILPKKQ